MERNPNVSKLKNIHEDFAIKIKLAGEKDTFLCKKLVYFV